MNKLANHDGHLLTVQLDHDHFTLRCATCGVEVMSEDNIDNDLAKTIRDRAMVLYKKDDDIEVDDDAKISMVEDGCWVEGWLWLSNYDFREEKEEVKEKEEKTTEAFESTVWIKPQPSVTQDIEALDVINRTELIGNGSNLLLMSKIREIARILTRHLAKSVGGK